MEMILKAKHRNPKPKGRYRASEGFSGRTKSKRRKSPTQVLRQKRVLYIDGGTGAKSWRWE